MSSRGGTGGRSGLVAVLVLPLATAVLAACSGSGSSGTQAVPQPTAGPTTSAPTVTTPEGGPALTTFNAPILFSCLSQDPAPAQVTIGCAAPSATGLVLTLDGSRPARGIQSSLPYEMPAGPPAGPGVTVVFACGAAQHTITLAWTMPHTPPTTRVVSVTKAAP